MDHIYFDYLNVDLLVEITSKLNFYKDVHWLSHVTNTWDDDIFWKRLVLKRYPKKYKRDYDYKTLYVYLLEYSHVVDIISDPQLASFLVFEDIVPIDVQKARDTFRALIKNNDIAAVQKVLRENPTVINEYDWYDMSLIALKTENFNTINEILKYFLQIEGIKITSAIDAIFWSYIDSVGHSISDKMINFMINYPGADKVSIISNMAQLAVEFDRLKSIIEKYNIEFDEIKELFNWFENSKIDDKIRTLKYMIKKYRNLFDDKENVDEFLGYAFELLRDEEYDDIAKDIMGIIYSLPVLRKEYPEFI